MTVSSPAIKITYLICFTKLYNRASSQTHNDFNKSPCHLLLTVNPQREALTLRLSTL